MEEGKMMKKILEHMNHEHKDVLPLYVRHFNTRGEEVKEAELLDVNEEEMTLKVNGSEEVKVKLTKKTKLEDLHMELVKMDKMAREALGIPREVPCKHAEEK